MQKYRTNPILVTGSHRSGTTWVGRMLNVSRYTRYIEEPFNECYTHVSREMIPHQFYYVRQNDKAPELKSALAKIMALQKMVPDKKRLRLFFVIRQQILHHMYKMLGLPRPIVKDPVAIFSTAWLAQTYNMDVICLIRHPAAFVMSLIKAEWPAEFESLLAQPALMEDHLQAFRHQMENPPHLFVERAALLWTVMYHVLSRQIDQHEKWLVMRLEDIANDPMTNFEKIFNFLELPYSRRIQHLICQYSNPDNPIEASTDNKGDIRRNSKAAQNVWRKRLRPEEIHAIRRIAEPISGRFYSDVDWKID